jgi:hypothetical protein
MGATLDMPIASFLPSHKGGEERRALERAVFARLARLVGEAVSRAPSETLAESASSLTDLGAMAEFLIEVAPALTGAAVNPLGEALLRGGLVKKELIDAAGGAVGAPDIAAALGITRQAVDKRRRARSLLAVPSASRDWLYPMAQFGPDAEPLPGLERVLRAFRVEAPWMQLDALLAPDPALGGRTAFEALRDGDVDAVVEVVGNFGEQGL